MQIRPAGLQSLQGATPITEPMKLMPQAGAKDFQSVMEKVSKAESGNRMSMNDLHKDLIQMREKILGGNKIPPQELILYQVRAQQFGLHVELLSRAGESVVATVRRLQSQG